MICLQEISEINSKPSARYALALFSLCQEDKTDNEIEENVLNLLEILKSDNGLNSFLRNHDMHSFVFFYKIVTCNGFVNFLYKKS